MATELTKLKRKRTSKRNVITKNLLGNIDIYLESPYSEGIRVDASCLLESLNEVQKIVKELDELIINKIEEEVELEKDEEESLIFDLKIKRGKEQLRTFLQKHNEDTLTTVSVSRYTGVKLPKLTIKKFNGDPVNWKNFIQSFEAAVDSKESLSNVEKFTYLKGYLSDSALQSIEGFPLTNDNYTQAMILLKERYGNPQLIVSSHMNALIKLERINGSNVKDLRQLYDKIESNARALRSVGIDPKHFGPLLIPIVLEKLPNVIRLQISRKLGKDNWDVEDFLKCINEEISARESYEFLKSQDNGDNEDRKSNTTSSLLIKQKEIICAFCDNKGHYSDKCTIVTDVNARRDKLKRSRCCFNCLRPGHTKKNCRISVKCFICKMRGSHNTALCTKYSQDEEPHSLVVNNNNLVLLQTANAFAGDINDTKFELVKIVFDSCSQQTYITESLAKSLNLKPIREVNMSIKSFGNKRAQVKTLHEYEVCIKPNDKGSSYFIKAVAVPTICTPISGQNINVALEKHPFLRDLKLADNGSLREVPVDVLIGADEYWKLVTGNIKKDDSSGLIAISSAMGWLISGPISVNEENSVNMITSHTLKIVAEKNDVVLLKDQLHNFWDLDTIGIAEKEVSVYEEFNESIKLEHGRYTVKLPFKELHPVLPDNFELSKKRLLRLKSRLDKDENLKNKYDDVIQDQLKCGVIEEVTTDKGTAGNLTYLPHREVIREDKSSTKIRVVFDASAKNGNNVSLNEILYKGPSLSTELYELLLKFRIHPIAITADIQKAYLQINVAEEHRDFLRFLWFDDVFADSPNIVKYRFRRVIFGATCSQFLLNGTVRKHGRTYESIDPDFARRVRKHFYIDDLNTGVNTVEEGMMLYKKIKLRFSECSFNITKWRTNNEELRNFINDREEAKNNLIENGKVLGIIWREKDDILVLNVKELFESAVTVAPTKRNVLKVIASVYDPIGYLQPVVVKLKLLFQQICLLDIKWDDHIGNLETKWYNIVEDLRKLSEIRINRCYYDVDSNDPVNKVYLHGFSDASEVAYGACIYIKCVQISGNTTVKLVTSKSRVAPLNKKFSIPRLELLGNFILAKLMNTVFNSLSEEMLINDYFCWTDSMITLAWIKAIDQEFKTFVENRVRNIRKNCGVEKWNYCKSADNPADIITRFNCCDINNQNNLWWKGPVFLKDSIENNLLRDNKLGENVDESQFNAEVSSSIKCMTHLSNESHTIGNILKIENYGDITKLLRITSWIMRFINNVKKKDQNIVRKCGNLSNEEIQNAKLIWIKENQNVLQDEKNYSEIVNSLNLFEDEDGIIRSKGRITNSSLPYETRLPIMLSKTHKLSKLLVILCHHRVKHNGVRQTLAEFRSNYWLTQGRSFVKKILFECVVCKRYNARPYNYPKPPDLPKERVSCETPFSNTGVDYMGPVYCKNVYGVNSLDEEDMHKAFIVLYTCASTRGVVLDLVPNGESKTFINSFIRFISRRGCPKIMLSDNGSVFTANDTQRFAAERNISWKYSIEYAPWHGGFWERLVASVKRCLKKTIGKACLSYVELQTVLLEIELILNTRPLLPLHDDDAEEILTPHHILYGRKFDMYNENTCKYVHNNQDESLLTSREKHVEKVINHFWERWRAEYLVSLREHDKKYKRRNEKVPNVNDIVLIFEEKQPRQNWKLGRTVELISSKDKEIRSVKLLVGKTNRYINRPVNRLFPLECRIDTSTVLVDDREQFDNTVENADYDEPFLPPIRNRRNAAELAELRLKYLYDDA